MGFWDYYERRPAKPVKNGIKTKSERGTIGETWWSKRWIAVLESFNLGARLTRGRSYARKGQVVSIDIEQGVVKAKVQGSAPRPYNVTIKLMPLSDADWDNVTDAMSAQAIFAAKLLAGEMPSNIEEAFSTAHVSLFPTRDDDLESNCSCPDWSNPCKHIAAVYYILAEQFDEDPFLIFKLRGRTKEQVIDILRAKRSVALPPGSATSTEETEPETMPLLEESLETFWQTGDDLDMFTIRPGLPEIDKAILKRLGDAPFKVSKQNLTAALAKAYDAVKAALEREDDMD